MDSTSSLFTNNVIFQANQAWIGGAIFGLNKASVSLTSTNIINNFAKKNGMNESKIFYDFNERKFSLFVA